MFKGKRACIAIGITVFLIFGYMIFGSIRLSKKADDVQVMAERNSSFSDTDREDPAGGNIPDKTVDGYPAVALPSKAEPWTAEYFMENNTCFTILNEEKIEILSPVEATEIAGHEAKDSRYQYQSWESEFEARSTELTAGLDESSEYHWIKEWKRADCENRLMWKVSLIDKNDPLTWLYLYVDAVAGEIVGAGRASD